VDNNYLNLGMNKSRFVHTLSSGRLKKREGGNKERPTGLLRRGTHTRQSSYG
jgi:hypothetical protein